MQCFLSQFLNKTYMDLNYYLSYAIVAFVRTGSIQFQISPLEGRLHKQYIDK